MGGQRLPVLDDSSERQASGFPLRRLPDGLDDGEDRIDPALGAHLRGLLAVLRRRLGGCPGLCGLQRLLLPLGGLLELPPRLSVQDGAGLEEPLAPSSVWLWPRPRAGSPSASIYAVRPQWPFLDRQVYTLVHDYLLAIVGRRRL